MGIHDDVRAHPLVVEGEVRLVGYQPAHAFLAVTTAEFIADLRSSGGTQQHLDQVRLFRVRRNQHLLHVGVRRSLVGDGAVLVARLGHPPGRLLDGLRHHRNGLIHQDLSVRDSLPGAADSVLIQGAVFPDRFTRLGVPAGPQDAIEGLVGVAFQRTRLLPVDETTPEAAVERGLVDDQGVLDVVAAVAHHGHGGVLTGR